MATLVAGTKKNIQKSLTYIDTHIAKLPKVALVLAGAGVVWPMVIAAANAAAFWNAAINPYDYAANVALTASLGLAGLALWSDNRHDNATDPALKKKYATRSNWQLGASAVCYLAGLAHFQSLIVWPLVGIGAGLIWHYGWNRDQKQIPVAQPVPAGAK